MTAAGDGSRLLGLTGKWGETAAYTYFSLEGENVGETNKWAGWLTEETMGCCVACCGDRRRRAAVCGGAA